jgi:hypothetical protein
MDRGRERLFEQKQILKDENRDKERRRPERKRQE